ncbi:transcriptional regulator, TetR family [Methylomagnum ishizawai]|uniref:Transcriptional regulator, TetR family n=1 Tax=Methylomagnum ishizawai TaxID=1760988 RepID=A0A1Y6DCB9_9GAMM|nr:transcriptional regulator, TetR family [Methylomagnum ishizawai]
MKTRKPLVISARKLPSQARSTRLVADILEAAVRVLVSGGARHFTAARVAEKAGISVGSLYQYFPNKEAILFRLQANEWLETCSLLEGILADSTHPPFERLREAVKAFFLSEWQEAGLRMALDDAAPLYRDTPEACEIREAFRDCVLAFMNEALPQVSDKDRAFAADMVITVMSAVGERISEQARSESEVNVIAIAISEMLCAYLERFRHSQHDIEQKTDVFL